MNWGSDYLGATRFFYMFLRWILDIVTALTGIIGLTLGFPINCIFWIVTFVYWGDETAKIEALKYMGFPNGG